jgi:hypothetical protein
MIQTDGTLEEIFGSSHIEVLHTGGQEEHSDIDTLRNNNINDDDDETQTSDKENDEFQINQTQKIANDQSGEELMMTNEERLTQNIARAIYEEAKNDALSKLGQEFLYHSDPER